jgi:hypothetical protein
MRKSTILKSALGMLAAFATLQAGAQNTGVAPRYGSTTQNNYHADYVGARFSVTAPASVLGAKEFTVANDGSGASGQWGRAIDSTWINVSVVRAYDSLACTALLNGQGQYPSMTGKWALLYRGNCQFSEKAYIAQQAGAKGVIIVNNVSGGPVGMAAGTNANLVTVPVIMISQADGNALNALLTAGQTVTVTMTKWGLNYNHDLGIIPGGAPLAHTYAIPATQVATGNGNPDAYGMVTGAFVGNFGTAASETAVKIKATYSFTPTSGGASVLATDSITIPTFNKVDSIMYGFSNNNYKAHASGTGRFDATYTVTAAVADDFPGDNSITVSQYVTDSIFSKGRYDFVNGKPVSNIGYQFGGTGSDYVWGPLYFNAKGGYGARKIQFTCSQANNPNLSNLAPINLLVFKWTDAGATADSLIQSGELELKGVATKTFGANDSGFQTFTVDVTDPNVTTKSMITEDNAWYWVAAAMPNGVYLGCDGAINYYPRSFGKFHETPTQVEFYAPIYAGTAATLLGSTTEQPGTFPFEAYLLPPDSVRFAEQKKGLVPAIAFHISKNLDKSSVSNTPGLFTDVTLFPNPAKDVLNVSLKMESVSSKVWFSVADGMGRTIYHDMKQNMQQGDVQIPTASLASGSYYLIINADKGTTVRKFVVTK